MKRPRRAAAVSAIQKLQEQTPSHARHAKGISHSPQNQSNSGTITSSVSKKDSIESPNGMHDSSRIDTIAHKNQTSLQFKFCDHFSSIRRDIVAPVLSRPHKWRCNDCEARSEVFICLSCGYCGCSRSIHRHAFSHFKEKHHPLSMRVPDAVVYCYKDEEWVLPDVDNHRHDLTLLRQTVNILAQGMVPGMMTRRGTLWSSAKRLVVKNKRLISHTSNAASNPYRTRASQTILSPQQSPPKLKRSRSSPLEDRNSTADNLLSPGVSVLPGLSAADLDAEVQSDRMETARQWFVYRTLARAFIGWYSVARNQKANESKPQTVIPSVSKGIHKNISLNRDDTKRLRNALSTHDYSTLNKALNGNQMAQLTIAKKCLNTNALQNFAVQYAKQFLEPGVSKQVPLALNELGKIAETYEHDNSKALKLYQQAYKALQTIESDQLDTSSIIHNFMRLSRKFGQQSQIGLEFDLRQFYLYPKDAITLDITLSGALLNAPDSPPSNPSLLKHQSSIDPFCAEEGDTVPNSTTSVADLKSTVSDKHTDDENNVKEDTTSGIASLQAAMLRRKALPKGRTGLKNLGNTCFINSVVQCLLHTRAYRNIFLRLTQFTYPSKAVYPKESPQSKHTMFQNQTVPDTMNVSASSSISSETKKSKYNSNNTSQTNKLTHTNQSKHTANCLSTDCQSVQHGALLDSTTTPSNQTTFTQTVPTVQSFNNYLPPAAPLLWRQDTQAVYSHMQQRILNKRGKGSTHHVGNDATVPYDISYGTETVVGIPKSPIIKRASEGKYIQGRPARTAKSTGILVPSKTGNKKKTSQSVVSTTSREPSSSTSEKTTIESVAVVSPLLAPRITFTPVLKAVSAEREQKNYSPLSTSSLDGFTLDSTSLKNADSAKDTQAQSCVTTDDNTHSHKSSNRRNGHKSTAHNNKSELKRKLTSDEICNKTYKDDDQQTIRGLMFYSQSNTLCVEMSNLTRLLWSGKWAVITPYALIAAIWNILPHFKGYNQHDAQEFFAALVDGLHEEFARGGIPANIYQRYVQRAKAYLQIHDKNISDTKPARKVSTNTNSSKRRRKVGLRRPLDPNQTKGAKLSSSSVHESMGPLFYKFRPSKKVALTLCGTFITTTTCCECGYKSFREEPFSCISVDLPSKKKQKKSTKSSETSSGSESDRKSGSNSYKSTKSKDCGIYKCLNHLAVKETLEGENAYACEQCQRRVQASRQRLLGQLPKVLTVHVNRAQWTLHGAKNKADDYVSFPLDDFRPYRYVSSDKMNHSRFTPNSDFSNNHRRKRNTKHKHQSIVTEAIREESEEFKHLPSYVLSGIVEHSGRGIDRGHYIAYCRDPYPRDDVWYKYNDHQVTMTSQEIVRTAQAYLLVYERADSRAETSKHS